MEYPDLPMSVERGESVEGTDMGEYLLVKFLDTDTMGSMAGRNRPREDDFCLNNIPANVSELRLRIIKYFQENKPELLECKVEKFL